MLVVAGAVGCGADSALLPPGRGVSSVYQGVGLNVHTPNPLLRPAVHTLKQVLRRMNTCSNPVLIHCSYTVHTLFIHCSYREVVFIR